ncbi:MAG: class I SAM-dependent methyltransferase [Caulobacteraceae bacterium]
MTERLVEDQYRDSRKLAARAALHLKYGKRGGVHDLARAIGLRPGWRVLDVGCGPGWFWSRSAEALPADLDLVLADLSPGMVDEALERVGGLGRWKSVAGQIANVGDLPFDDAAFDAVLAMHMLYHAPNPERGIAEIARVLRPGGMAVVTTNALGNMIELHAIAAAAFGGPARDPGAAAFSLESGEPMLGRHFASVEVHRTRDVLAITDPADVVAALTSYPPGDTLGPDDLSRLDSVVEAAFAAGAGVLEVTRETGWMVARKLG